MAVKRGSQYAWWYLSRQQKDLLEQERRGGRFGGGSAKAVGKAPYFWVQEHGEPRAMITGRHWVAAAIARWHSRAASIVRESMKVV